MSGNIIAAIILFFLATCLTSVLVLLWLMTGYVIREIRLWRIINKREKAEKKARLEMLKREQEYRRAPSVQGLYDQRFFDITSRFYNEV